MNRRFVISAMAGGGVAAIAACIVRGAGPFAGGESGPPLATIEPSAKFDGTAGSGFAGEPADPARVTAKPAVRLITPPCQTILDEVTIGVAAWANDRGSLLNTCGVEKVVVHYEGTSHAITTPTIQRITDANGNDRFYFAWWIRLKNNGTHGQARAYFEAVPRDPAMQHRVIGPYLFLPSATEYDYEVTVAPSRGQIAGSRYASVASALGYLKRVGSQRGHITITEAGGAYDLASVMGGYRGSAGYCTVDASVPVTFGYPACRGDAASQIRPKYDGLRFRGRNITFDFRNVSEIRQERAATIDYWFDGINFIVSGAGRAELWRKGRRPVGMAVRWPAWFTECDISGVSNPCFNAQLVRGCYFHKGHNDCVSESRCVIGCRTDDWDSVAAGLHVDVPALEVGYTGPEARATLALTGGSDGARRTFTATWGANSSTFTVLNTEAAFEAGTNYNVADVAAWLADLSGWTATVIDDTRRATALSLPGLKGRGFADINVKDAAIRLVTEFDSHTDWYAQINPGNVKENAVIQDNVIVNFRGQGLFLAGDDGAKDYVVVNNAWFHKVAEGGYAANSSVASQMNWAQSHVVIAHCSWATQKFNFRTDAGYDGDRYCMLANSTAPRITWLGPVDRDVTVRNNHLQGGAVAPAHATGTTIGGTYATLFGDAARGDFSPKGALLANPKPPTVRYDRRGRPRAASAPVGALGG